MTKKQLIENLKLREARAYERMLCADERELINMTADQLDRVLRSHRNLESEWMALNTLLHELEINAYHLFERYELHSQGILPYLSKKTINSVNY